MPSNNLIQVFPAHHSLLHYAQCLPACRHAISNVCKAVLTTVATLSHSVATCLLLVRWRRNSHTCIHHIKPLTSKQRACPHALACVCASSTENAANIACSKNASPLWVSMRRRILAALHPCCFATSHNHKQRQSSKKAMFIGTSPMTNRKDKQNRAHVAQNTPHPRRPPMACPLQTDPQGAA